MPITIYKVVAKNMTTIFEEQRAAIVFAGERWAAQLTSDNVCAYRCQGYGHSFAEVEAAKWAGRPYCHPSGTLIWRNGRVTDDA